MRCPPREESASDKVHLCGSIYQYLSPQMLVQDMKKGQRTDPFRGAKEKGQEKMGKKTQERCKDYVIQPAEMLEFPLLYVLGWYRMVHGENASTRCEGLATLFLSYTTAGRREAEVHA